MSGKNCMTGDIERILLDEETIKKRVRELGEQLSKDYEGEEVILLCILKGACVFFSDLARAMDVKLKMDFMGISSYGDAVKTSGIVRLTKDIDTSITGKHVLIAEDIMDARVRKRFRAMLTESIDCERPGEWNQAMMDLGATVCLPNGAPLCEKCPARAFCAAYQNGMTDVLPVRAAKKPRRVEERTVFLLVRDGRLALRKRPAKGLLAGLWELPNVPGNLDEAGAAITLAQWGLTARTLMPVGAAKHIFSHVEWDMHGYLAAAEGENNEFLWADGAALQAAAIPSAFRYYFDTAVRWLAAQQGGTDHGTALL